MPYILSEYKHEDLISLIDKLNTRYYDVLKGFSVDASVLAVKLNVDQNLPSAALYCSLSLKLLERVNDLVKLRQDVLIPYIKELIVKKEQGHDCRECSRGCHVTHNGHLLTIKDSHKHIKEILFRLQSVALPLYTDNLHSESYSELRSKMTKIDTLLTELFYLEEASLVSKVLAAQKSIHA